MTVEECCYYILLSCGKMASLGNGRDGNLGIEAKDSWLSYSFFFKLIVSNNILLLKFYYSLILNKALYTMIDK